MMDIESALKNIGDWISKETESRKYPKGELLEISESLQTLKTEIARQSVKREDVAEAIERIHCTKWDYDKTWHNTIDLAITALKAYEPTTQKNRIVEEVAISKTETTSVKKITVDIQLRPLLDDLEVDIEDVKEYIKKLD